MVMKSVLKNQAFLTRDTLGFFVLCCVAVCGMTLLLSVCWGWGGGGMLLSMYDMSALKADPMG